ncbi:unnamed protein product [Schistocephalus solidus]|uniref:Lipoprotein n=1 Tax=Schistocephalus solidus TaxID=70667 RepID=A0A183TF34_SCHSO|nr:unnamed protein product [Schistocephalus solidus]
MRSFPDSDLDVGNYSSCAPLPLAPAALSAMLDGECMEQRTENSATFFCVNHDQFFAVFCVAGTVTEKKKPAATVAD